MKYKRIEEKGKSHLYSLDNSGMATSAKSKQVNVAAVYSQVYFIAG